MSNPLASIRHMWQHYFDFRGTTSRSQFWWYTFFAAIMLVLINAGITLWFQAFAATASGEQIAFRWQTGFYSLGSGIAQALNVLLLIPVVSGFVRRRNDAGRGWRLPLVVAVLLVLVIEFGPAALLTLANLPSLGYGAVLVVVLANLAFFGVLVTLGAVLVVMSSRASLKARVTPESPSAEGPLADGVE